LKPATWNRSKADKQRVINVRHQKLVSKRFLMLSMESLATFLIMEGRTGFNKNANMRFRMLYSISKTTCVPIEEGINVKEPVKEISPLDSQDIRSGRNRSVTLATQVSGMPATLIVY
jgi:hypothetical protein